MRTHLLKPKSNILEFNYIFLNVHNKNVSLDSILKKLPYKKENILTVKKKGKSISDISEIFVCLESTFSKSYNRISIKNLQPITKDIMNLYVFLSSTVPFYRKTHV